MFFQCLDGSCFHCYCGKNKSTTEKDLFNDMVKNYIDFSLWSLNDYKKAIEIELFQSLIYKHHAFLLNESKKKNNAGLYTFFHNLRDHAIEKANKIYC